jgi:hypothetical protein
MNVAWSLTSMRATNREPFKAPDGLASSIRWLKDA